jgi:hypothetical protein
LGCYDSSSGSSSCGQTVLLILKQQLWQGFVGLLSRRVMSSRANALGMQQQACSFFSFITDSNAIVTTAIAGID